MKLPLRLLILLLAWAVLGPPRLALAQICANPGNDGSTFSATPNSYYPGVTAVAGSTSITVGTIRSGTNAGATAIAAKDLLLVIQMQGADITTPNTNAYGAVTNNANFTAGQYEYVVVSAVSGTTITTTTSLTNTYTTSTTTTNGTSVLRRFQVVRVPQYSTLTLGSNISPPAWDGSTGGIVALDVAGNLNFGGFTIDASGLGFRGGGGVKVSYSATTTPNTQNANDQNYFTIANATASLTLNAMKGEGIAGSPRYTATSGATAYADNTLDGYPSGSAARGAPANAGGGGNDNGNNSGGAGGANGGAGGRGGNSSNSPTAPNIIGGEPSKAFSAVSSNRLVMGGGGGAGTTNDGTDANNNTGTGFASSGAAGGGVVIVRTGTTSGSGGISANGGTAAGVRNDGGGGGGAGGSILLTATTSQSGLASLTMSAIGGTGGSTNPAAANNGSTAHGPGGGGGGGVVLTTGSTATALATSTAAGSNGTSTPGTTIGSAAGPFGAAAGTAGTSVSSASVSNTIASSTTGSSCIADLSSTITSLPASTNTGQTVTVQANFSNAGPLATTATGTVTLPAGTTVTSAPGGTISVNAGVTTITYPNASLNPNNTTTFSTPFTITYTAAAAGTYAATSNITTTSTTEGGQTANNSASASTTVSGLGGVGTPAPCATPGKDGAGSLATNPDTYYPSNGAQTLAVGATTINLGTATGAGTTITAGDLLLVIQMQGADINSTNTDSYGDGVAGGGANGTTGTNYTAGQYEYVVAKSYTGGVLTLNTGLVNAYSNAVATTTTGQRTFQVVRVPQYTSLTLTASITATPWNGSTGGIIALDVVGATNLAGFTINATGAGFRGGAGRILTGIGNATGFATSDYRTSSASAVNGTKGEGTAGTPRYVNSGTAVVDTRTSTNGLPSTLTDGYPNGDNGRGAPGTAGGGGTDGDPTQNQYNTGGGGGANGGAGGRGGNSFSNNLAIGGEPGAAFAVASSSRLVLGGGGGSGTTNNGTGDAANDGYTSSGAAGGGIVILRTGSIGGTAGSITASGTNANNSTLIDGGGGGGAGGSILITATNTTGLASLALTASGGSGGNTNPNSSNAAGHGPGGGGGGGVILTNASTSSATVAVGTAGISTTNSGNTVYGAAAGAIGVAYAQISTSIANSTSGVTCGSDVTVALNGPTTLTGGQPTGNFTATFTNEGPQTASAVTQTVTLPTGATLTTAQQNTIKAAYPNATFSTAGSGTNPITTINFGTATTLTSGNANTFVFAFTAPTTTGTSALTAAVSTTTSQGADVAPNSTSLTLTTGGANVVAGITAGTATVAPGATATFTASFSNTGPQDAANVVRTVQLPTGLTVASITGNGTYNSTTGLVTYPATTLTSGAAASTSVITFTMPTTGPVVGTASVSTTTSEGGQTADNVASATVALGAQFDLATTLYGPATVVAGSPTTLNVTTTNNGPQAVAGALQTVQLASGLTNVYVSGGGIYNPSTSATTVTFNGTSYSVPAGAVIFPPTGSLPSGQTVANTIMFNAPTTTFAPVATVTPNTTGAGDTNTANNTAYLNGSTTSTSLTVNQVTATTPVANLYAILSTTSTVVSAGTQVTFTAGVGNDGPTAVTGVNAQLQLIPGLTASMIQLAGQTGTSNGTTITFNGGATYTIATGILTYPTNTIAVPSGSSTSSTVTVTMPTTVGNNGQFVATLSVSSTSSSDNVPSDNVKAATVTVIPTTDLATTIIGPTSPSAGQQVSYTATFTNNGPDFAAATTEAVQLPTGLTNVTVLDNQGNAVTNTYNATTGRLTLPTITSDAVGASQVFTIAFAAPAQSYSVSSTIGSNTLESITTNNSASINATVTPTADVATYLSGPATAVAGNAVTYVATTVNNGSGSATGVAATLQLPAGLSGVSVSSGSYDSPSGLVTFATTATLLAGASTTNYVTFTMPTSPTNGQVSGVASVTTTSTDNVASNNTAGITTDVAPATASPTNLAASITAPSGSLTAGSTASYTFTYSNTGTVAATSVAPVANLPAGLSNVVVSNGGSYNATTGLVTWPTIATQAAGSSVNYTVSFATPANGPVVVTSAVSSATSENVLTDNLATSSVNVTASYDAVTSLSGPATALPGSANVYAVTTTNNGPSTAPSVTQTVTLPTGVTAMNITNGSQSGNVITFNTLTNQVAGTNGAVTNTFTLTMPTSGNLALSATVAASGESNTANDGATLTTTPANLPPVAQNIVNSLQSARGNTALALPISPLNAVDAGGSIASYTLTTLPDASQGVLYYNGAVASTTTVITDATQLSFLPATGFVGNAFFTYTATDNGGAVSNTALYTIPVAADQNTTYTATPAKGGSAKYATNDVLAYTIDPNTAVYNNAGQIYNATTGVLQTNTGNLATSNGLGAAMLATTGPTQNPSNTLPSGVSVNALTGQIYVSNASLLPKVTQATTYYVNVVTTDLNGGRNTALATFTIGAYPLPVELTAFTAQAVSNRDALLNWATASELNSATFVVERSLDGTTFTKVGQLAAQGTKSTATSYTFTDAGVATLTSGSPVYYRLRQLDQDGTATFSQVRTVSFTQAASVALSLYPNPAQTTTTLDLSQLPATGSYQVLVLDATGRQVLATTLAGGLAQQLDVAALASGTYNVLVSGTKPDGTPLRTVLRLTKD